MDKKIDYQTNQNNLPQLNTHLVGSSRQGPLKPVAMPRNDFLRNSMQNQHKFDKDSTNRSESLQISYNQKLFERIQEKQNRISKL